jgi:hypothetical protein
VRTVEPFTEAAGVRLRTRSGLSEEGFEADPRTAPAHLGRLLERGEPAVLCTHGPVLPSLLDDLEGRLDLDQPASVEVIEEFAEARDDRLAKGEALVCHVVGTGAMTRASWRSSGTCRRARALTLWTKDVRMPFTVRSPATGRRVTRRLSVTCVGQCGSIQ